MVSQQFHADGEGEKPPRIMFRPTKRGSAQDEQQTKLGQAVIITTEGTEYDAICAHLHNLGEGIHQRMIYAYGTFAGNRQEWDVKVIEIGMEGDNVSLIAERAIHYFQPDVILLISTAYGLQDVQPGDVVSATKVYAYEPDKTGAKQQAKSAIWNVTSDMKQQIAREAERLSWLQRIKDNLSANMPHVVLAPIISGEEEIRVIDAQEATLLRTQYESIIAVEQGVYGITQATRATKGINTLVVCGIAETLQETNIPSEDGRMIAAEHASAFAFEILAGLESKKSSQPKLKTPEPKTQTAGPLASTHLDGAIEIFYSYVASDEALVQKLQMHMMPLKRAGHISNWDMNQLVAGRNLREHLRHLETARLILLLISPSYISSEHHYKIELKRALEKGEAGDVSVVPILLRPTPGLALVGFDELQIIPRNGKAITEARNQEQIFAEIADEIGKIVKALRGDNS